ncbi:MAG: DUF305 domain-containing protein [Patescibacteria group bacterium]
MNKEIVLYGIVGLVVGSIATLVFASNAVNHNMTGAMGMMGIHTEDRTNNVTNERSNMMGSIDRHFIEQMIPHHEDAITMANLALVKAKHPEVKKLAQNIIRTQTEEITKMKSWYRNWFGSDVPTNTSANAGMMGGNGIKGGMMGSNMDLDKLKNADDFDKAFIEDMIPHHQTAVMMANMLQSGTNRVEMKQLSKDIIDAQTKEIDDMRTWYKEWYR